MDEDERAPRMLFEEDAERAQFLDRYVTPAVDALFRRWVTGTTTPHDWPILKALGVSRNRD